MVYCSVCNTIYAPGTRYCIKCKTHLSFLPTDTKDGDQIKCPSCGETTSVETGTCQFCSNSLSAETLDLSQSIPVIDPVNETPKSKPKRKKKKTSRSATSQGKPQSPIKTFLCPKCGNVVLTDFENCPHCGIQLLQPTSSSNVPKPAITDAVKNEKENSAIAETGTAPASEIESKQLEEEVVWETMECPSCHKVTRINTGLCRHCNASLLEHEIVQAPSDKEEPIEIPEPSEAPSPPQEIKVPSKETMKESTPAPRAIPPSPAPVTPPQPQSPPIEKSSEKPAAVPLPTISENQKHSSYMGLVIVIIGVVGVMALIGIFLTTYFFQHSKSTTETVQSIAQSKPATNPISPIPAAKNDSDAISQVLDNVRQAIFSKDTVLYLSAFSPQFQDLEQKQKGLNTLWETYQIEDLKYDISPDHPLAIKDNQADVVVTWKMNLKKLSNKKDILMNENDYVRFEKQNGNWKIVEVSAR